jgi:hypothetical protein
MMFQLGLFGGTSHFQSHSTISTTKRLYSIQHEAMKKKHPIAGWVDGGVEKNLFLMAL